MSMTMMKRQREAVRLSANAAAKITAVGQRVHVTLDDGTSKETATLTLPWQLGHGHWVVNLEGLPRGYDCARVRPIA